MLLLLLLGLYFFIFLMEDPEETTSLSTSQRPAPTSINPTVNTRTNSGPASPDVRYVVRTMSDSQAQRFMRNHPSEWYQVAPGVIRYKEWTGTKQDDGSWRCEAYIVSN